MPTKTQARPIFAATLTPPRALTPVGKRVVVGLVAALAALPGVIFYIAGAWPVVGFMGLDVLAIWIALTVSMRSSRQEEVVTLWPGRLELKRTSARGVESTESFVPAQVRFVIARDFNERVTGLELREGDRHISFGSFLSGDEKLSFSKAFGTALRRARA